MKTVLDKSIENIYFVSQEHRENLFIMFERFPRGKESRDFLVACYIIAHPEIFRKATGKEWDYPFDDWVEKQDFSSGFRRLIDAGFHIYSGGTWSFNLSDGLASWDESLLKVFLQACILWRM